MPEETTVEVRWDDCVIPDVVRVVESTEYPNAIAIERNFTEDASLKTWMDSVLYLTMRQELDDLSKISKDVSVRELADAENSRRIYRRCKPLEYITHPASRTPPGEVAEDSVESLVLQYDEVGVA